MSTTLTPGMRRSSLIAMLRDKTLWPEGFEWNFARCDKCGMGMLMKHMGYTVEDVPFFGYGNKTSELLGLSKFQIKLVFQTPLNPEVDKEYSILSPEFEANWRGVTPEMVADRLEAVHKELSQ